MDETKDPAIFFFPPLDTVCTKAFSLFLADYKDTINSFYFMLTLANRADDVSVHAAKALIDGEADEARRKQLQDTINSPGRNVQQLNKFGKINSKNIAADTVEGFLWYVSNIIQESIKRRPEMIRSSETIRVEEVLNHRKMGELINFLIDRKINSLSYGGLKQIEKYLEETLGVSLFHLERDRDLLRIFIEVRNIHAHNRGFVNKVFLARVGECLADLKFDFREGQRAHLDYDSLCLMSNVCIKTALWLDDQASKKFRIERKRIATWHNAG